MSREQQIRDRVAAATPGEWVPHPAGIVYDQGGETVALVNPNRNMPISEFDGNTELIAYAPTDLTYLLDRVKELEDALEIVNNGVDDWGGSYVNLQVQMSEVEEGRAVLAKRNL